MLLVIKKVAIKKSRTVGTRDRVIKATTNLVLSLAPRTFFFLSKTSLTTLRRMRRKRRTRRRILRPMREINRRLLGKGAWTFQVEIWV